MPAPPLIESNRLRRFVLTCVMLAIFAASLGLAAQYSVSHKPRAVAVDGLTLAVGTNFDTEPLEIDHPIFSDVNVLTDDRSQVTLVLASMSSTTPLSSAQALAVSEELPLFRNVVPIKINMIPVKRLRNGELVITRRNSYTEGGRQSFAFFNAVATVDGGKYWAIAMFAPMSFAREIELLKDTFDAILSTARVELASATDAQLQAVGLTAPLPAGLTPLATEGQPETDEGAGITFISKVEPNLLSTIRVRNIDADPLFDSIAAGEDASAAVAAFAAENGFDAKQSRITQVSDESYIYFAFPMASKSQLATVRNIVPLPGGKAMIADQMYERSPPAIRQSDQFLKQLIKAAHGGASDAGETPATNREPQ